MNLRLDTHRIGNEDVYEIIAEPEAPRTDLAVSSVRLWRLNEEHTRLRFWNRGRSTGDWVVVRTKDALEIVARLFGLSLREFATVVTESMRAGFHAVEVL